jgi:hypothetical protein
MTVISRSYGVYRVSRCCESKCERSEFRNADGLFLVTITNDIKAANEFKATWDEGIYALIFKISD